MPSIIRSRQGVDEGTSGSQEPNVKRFDPTAATAMQVLDVAKYVRLSENVQRFVKLRNAWRVETEFESSTTRIAMNWHYQEIIGMGKEALPMIFDELRRDPDHWFWALRAITCEDPVPPGAISFQEHVEAWLRWGRAHNYVKGC